MLPTLSEDDLSLHKSIEIKQECQDSKFLDIYHLGQNGDLELSEEFLSSIIKQVEDVKLYHHIRKKKVE